MNVCQGLLKNDKIIIIIIFFLKARLVQLV